MYRSGSFFNAVHRGTLPLASPGTLTWFLQGWHRVTTNWSTNDRYGTTGEVEIATAQKPNLRIICHGIRAQIKKKIVLLLKIEILENNPERSPKIGGLYFSEEQPAVLWGEEETILLGRSDFSSSCGQPIRDGLQFGG